MKGVDIEEAFHDFKLVLASIEIYGGNVITSLMEHGYTEAVARYIIDKYYERYTK